MPLVIRSNGSSSSKKKKEKKKRKAGGGAEAFTHHDTVSAVGRVVSSSGHSPPLLGSMCGTLTARERQEGWLY